MASALTASTAELRSRIAKVPRIRLAYLPTPLHELSRLGQLLGIRLLIKRDDLTGLALGGNKTRNLEFRLAEAQGATDVVAVLDVQSNSAVQTTAAANRLGMRTHLFLHGAEGEGQGNLLLDRVLGAEVTISETEADAASLAAELTASLLSSGKTVYDLNRGRMFRIGSCLAYALCLAEIAEQCAEIGARPDAIYLSSAGKGQSGLVFGCLALDLPISVVGIAARPAPEAAEVITATVHEASELLDIDLGIRSEEVINDDAHCGYGYKAPSPAGLRAIDLTAAEEGILLDPTYTGKAMAGLIEHARSGRIRSGSTVVFIHTGGAADIFAEQAALTMGGRT